MTTATHASPPRGAPAAGSRVKVLVVDDSALIRRILGQVLAGQPSIEVVGSAADGSAALAQIARLKPDVVTLDLEMPVLDGLEVLRRLRREHFQGKVIVLSALSERGATITMDALALGASDYLLKPAGSGGIEGTLDRLRTELVPKILHLRPREIQTPAAARAIRSTFAPRAGVARRAILIGVSTGGPNTLNEIIPQLPVPLSVPVLIVQHMPPMFTRMLAERLQTRTKLRVVEAKDGMRIEPGTIYIAPGDFHMRVSRRAGDVIQLDQGPPEQSCRPSVDVLFRSAAEIWGGGLVAAVLTGMGQDGLRGAELLRAKGAFIIAQDEKTSVVWGMPGAITKAGLAHLVLPSWEIVPAIAEQIR
jgi:two-component system chemotaxis response regulator CheB